MSKEKVQKVILLALFGGGLLYVYFVYLLGPLGGDAERAREAIEVLREDVRKADTVIRASAQVEEEGREAEEFLASASEYFREGTPIAWFPPMITDFFRRQGIGGVVVTSRGSASYAAKALAGYDRLRWDIQFPAIDFFRLGNTLAAIENEQPFAEVTGLTIGRTAGDPALQRVGMDLSLANKDTQ